MSLTANGVFINVPFDQRYKKLFDALVFAAHDCGLEARCAQEEGDSSQVRLEKLYGIISDCRFGIHDLSRVSLDSKNRLPRLNMPLELGIFLGAKRYGNSQQRQKSCLILDRDQYRYQVFCSDIAGQDIRAHHNQVQDAIFAVRNWLRSTGLTSIPGGERIAQRYIQFRRALPQVCKDQGLAQSELGFLDYRDLVVVWRDANPL